MTTTVVVGGGVIGMAVAWRLGRDGHDVVVVDPDAGHGASWAAAGMLAPISEATFGEDALLALSLAAVRRWPDVERELADDGQHDIGLRRDGTLNVALDHDDRRALDRLTEFRASWGLPVERLTGSQARRLEPYLSPSVRGGVLAADDLSVDNRRYWTALHAAALAHGTRTVAGTVERVVVDRGRVLGVVVDGTTVAGDVVVVAAGSRSGLLPGLDERLRLPVRPVKGQILRLGSAPLGPAGHRLLTRTVRALVRGRDVYVVPRETGEIVVGATVEEKGDDLTVTAGAVRELLRDACEALPVLDELELLEARAGLRPGTPDNGPIVGRVDDVEGLVVATGHYRNGVLLSPVTADAVADLVAGRDLAAYWKPFTPDRFLGGPR